MKKSKCTEEQILFALKQADGGMQITNLHRKHGFLEASFYLWRSKFGGMEVSDARRRARAQG